MSTQIDTAPDTGASEASEHAAERAARTAAGLRTAAAEETARTAADTDSDASTIARDLSESGLRSTAGRRATLHVLSRGGHFDASEVFDLVKQDLPGTSLQAIYGVLAALTEAGLVRKIEPAGGPAHFERRIGDNHHHLVCSQCGRIEDVPCAIGEAPCLTASHTHGFAIASAEVTFTGLCPDCRTG